jgi:hypothetical protein
MMFRGGSLKHPRREGLPSFKIGIVKNKIKTTVVARTDERFVFAKTRVLKEPRYFPEMDPSSNFGHGEAPEEERE